MTSVEKAILSSIIRRVIYFQKQNFDRYVILDYIDGAINSVRKSNCSDDLLRYLFDTRQKVLLGKEVKIGG